ncbi:hypothetical protein ALFP_0034 [Alcaligenes faecalis]|nr:hypothetical protein ALFP_0034 [Alcaligenes faecalis]
MVFDLYHGFTFHPYAALDGLACGQRNILPNPKETFP